MKQTLFAVLCGYLLPLVSLSAYATDVPPPEAFRVLPPESHQTPEITSYLKYQAEMAWQQDERRRKAWEGIESEQDLRRVQEQIRKHLLARIGGLPSDRTPLHARVTGQIQIEGFHIKKLI